MCVDKLIKAKKLALQLLLYLFDLNTLLSMLPLKLLLCALLDKQLELIIGVRMLVLVNEDLLHFSSAFLERLAVVTEHRDIELVVMELDKTGFSFPAVGFLLLN